MTRSRDVMAMDLHASDTHMVSFEKRSGCFVSRSVVWLFIIFFVSALIATGLLVYFFAPDIKTDDPVSTSKTQIVVEKLPDIKILPTASTTRTTTKKPPINAVASTPTSSQNPTTKEKIDVHLPRALRPIHYLVKLQPFINGNFSILGYVEVEIEVLEATTNITLHLADIITYNDTIKLRPLEDPAGPGLAIASHQYDRECEFYVARLKQPLLLGHKYVLSMHFIGLLNDMMKGFYRSSYRNADGTETRVAATQFQATDARRAFPCFDEPGLKATFEVHLARQQNMTSLSNMPIKETLPMDHEGWVWDHYQTTVPMSTYLLAFVVSDFVYLNSSTNSGILFRTWARESALDQAKYSSQIGPAILDHFEHYFNESYPLPKQDMIAIPDFSAGAMENWGLITYRETTLLYDPLVSTSMNKFHVAAVVAHELAHQWFGNLVTPRWWTDLWLNEGFASYVEFIGIESVEPSWKVMEMFVELSLQSAMDYDNIQSSHPIRIEVHHPNEISQIFDRITYAKGSTVIRMMNHFLTESVFRHGLSNYLEAFKYDNAEQDDLWRHLTEAAHEAGTLPQDLTVKAIMDTWTLQMGYPIIKVERSADGTSATVSQERFLLVKDDNAEDTHDYKWWVPLTYTSQDQPDFTQTQAKAWMKDTEEQVTVTSLPPKDQWVIFNLQQTGYYKVNYDNDNWNLLIQQLLTNHSVIATVNRAQIIDDALDLARAGQLRYNVTFKVLSYLGKETDYLPWKVAINSLTYVKTMFELTGAYGALKNYMQRLVLPIYNALGFDDNPSFPLRENLLRQSILNLACQMKHQPCLDNANRLFRQWMLDPDNATIITPNVKWVVYCQALAAGGEVEWNFAWGRYLKSNVGSEKTRLLSAMGCTKQQWLLSRYLDMAFDDKSGIKKQDSQRVFSAVAYNSVGRPLAWDYLRSNWRKIYDFFGGEAKGHLISSVMNYLNTEQHLKEVMAFKEDRKDELAAASRTVDMAIEKIQNNILWMKNNYKTIGTWLREAGYNIELENVWHEEEEQEMLTVK